MAARPKPWELPLAEEDPSDTRVARGEDPKETDALLPEKLGGNNEKSDTCDYTFGLKSFITTLEKHFGYKLLWLLFAAQFLLKGFARDFIGKAEPYIFKLYHIPAGQMQIYTGVTALPWAMKPIVGLVSDLFPIGGYNKAPYMCFTSVLGVAAFLTVGFTTESLPVHLVVLCFIVIQLQVSTADLLSEAKYAEKIREKPEHGPNLMTYVWFGMQVGGVFAVLGSGVAIARFGPRALYVIAVLPAALVLLPVALNYLQEKPLTSQQAADVWAHFASQGETVVLCGIMLFGTLTLTVVDLTVQDTAAAAAAAIIVALVVLIGFSLLLSPTIAKFNAFSLIQSSLTFQLGGAAFYFFTDTPEQYPEGPHFSPFFFNSVVGVVTASVSLIGIYTYQRYMTTWKYRSIFIVTNLGFTFLCLPDLLMYSRYNLVLGIPDHAFMLGAAVAQSIVGAWQWMPQVVILANLCPKGMEATMYALLAGSHNLGNTIGSNCGALMLDWLGCTPSGVPGESDKFTNLWKASAISCSLPLITILALFWLIPDARQDESLIDDSCTTATSGSLWRRWTGRDDAPGA